MLQRATKGEALLQRGFELRLQEDFASAIVDYTAALQVEPGLYAALLCRYVSWELGIR